MLHRQGAAQHLTRNLLSTTRPAPTAGAARPTTSYTYTGDQEVLTQTNALGQTVQLVYNSFGEKVEEIDPSPDGGHTPGPVQKWSFDADGDMVGYVNAMGQSYVYKVNDRGERVEEDDPSPDGGPGSSNPVPGPVWKWSYSAAGELVEEVDPMGRVSQWVHDGDGNVIQTIAPNVSTGGPGDASTTTFDTYDLDGENISETPPQPAGSSGSTTTTWQFDALGDMTEKVDPTVPGGQSPVTQYFYNADQELVQEIDPLGRVQTNTLDGLGRTTASTSFTGVTEQFGYDALSNLITTTDSSGTVTNTFDALGRETKTVDQASGTTTMGYNLLGSMTSLVDPSNNQTTWQLNGLNRVTSDTNQLGASETFQYNAAGQVVQEVDKDGRTRTFEYDDLGRQTAENWLANSNGVNVAVSVTQVGSGGYKNTDQLITLPQQTSGGTFTLSVYGETTSPIPWNASPDEVQAALETLSAIGRNVTVQGWGQVSNPYEVQFDGALTGVDVPSMTAAAALTYRGLASVSEVTAGHGYERVDEVYCEFAGFQLGKETFPEQGAPTYQFVNIPSEASAPTVQADISSLFPGVLVSGSWPYFWVTFPDTTPSNESLVASGDGQVNPETPTPPQNEEQSVTINPVEDGTFTLSFGGQTTAPLAYNAAAGDIQAALAALSAIGAGNVGVTGNAGGPWTVTFEGALGGASQPLLIADGANLAPPISVNVDQSGQTGPDTVQSVVVDAVGGSFALTFHGQAQTTYTTAPIAYGAPAAAVQSALNALPGVFVTVAGAATADSPYLVTFGGAWSGQSVNVMTADTSGLLNTFNTIATAYNADGSIASIGDNFSHYAYTYNGQGEVASVDNAGTPGVPHVVLSSGYDAAGNRSSSSATISGTADFLNSYSYNTLSQLVQIVQQGQNGGNAVAPKEIDYSVNAIGDVTGRSAFNFIGIGPRYDIASEAISYNPLGLLTGISMTSHADQVNLDNLTYSYDTLARVSTFGSIDGSVSYGYDPTSQLTSATYTAASGHTEPPNLSLAFDPNGNRSTVNGTSTTVSPNNEVTNDGTFTYKFDAEGNRTVRTRISTAYASDSRTTYGWDYRNRLTDVETFDNNGVLTQHVHYAYDVWDHLIERDVDPNGGGTYAEETHYVWDASAPPSLGHNGQPPLAPGNIDLAFNGSEQLTARYLDGPNSIAYDQFFSTLAEEDVASTTSAGPVSFFLLDAEGTLTDIANSNGALADHLQYNPFGQLFSESNPSVLHLAGYAGGLYDSSTGLVYFIHRWYDPQATVWISADPTGFYAGDANRSRYVSNDPTDETDPSGLYGRDGHFWTTYIVAVAAGLDGDDAYALAYYSQLPDQDRRYEAISAAKAHYNPLASCPSSWAPNVFNWLHSLHGGGFEEIQQRRARLARLILDGTDDDGNQLSAWQLGFIIHAFGDSYAHTHFTSSGPRAYGWPWGHARDAHTPDIIASNREKYKTYVRELYRVLGGCNEAGNPLLQRLIERADISEDDPDAAATWLGLFARQYAGYRRAYLPTDNFNVDDDMDTPSRDDVSDLMGTVSGAGSQGDE